jgi:crotonobetainyl-CoA:carnitine CoA-transferase CaiB-like acyl-CoA transferase
VHVPDLGDIEVFGLTALFDRTPGAVTTPPPTLGQHNAEIFGRLGYGSSALAEFKKNGVI